MDDKISGTTIILFILMLTLSVDSAILSYQNRHDDHAAPRTLQKISINQARQLLHRQRRAAPTASHRMLSKEVVLDGTEDHTHAYVHWSGKLNSEVVFILTLKVNSSGVVDSQTWRSDDYGSTYRKLPFNGALISYFFVSPANHSKMVFTDVKNKHIYTSENEMASKTKKFSLPVGSDNIRMHKEKSDWMLLYDYFQRKLYCTMDFGISWKLLASDVNTRFYWGMKGYDDKTDVVHMEVQPLDSEQAYYKRCTIPDCNSPGDGIDYKLGPFMPQTLLLSYEYILVQKSNLDGTDSHMMVSYKRKSFTHTYFPDNVKTQDFLLLDASEGQVFVAVNHGDRSGVSLYLSDPTGRYYVLSLSNVNHLPASSWFDVDIHRVQGLTGIYLANQRMNGYSRKRLKSLISFDKGGTWLDIPSPQKNCTSDSCAFLLRLDDSYMNQWILSEEKAPGFIIAHGHFGRNYDQDWRNLTVFTSMDGGYKWDKSNLTGAYHFNILDQGSLVTAIKTGNQEPTNLVHYTYDEGKTWQQDTFGDKKLTVDGVLNEPGINTLVASVYGHINSKAAWTMIKLNFSQVLDRPCSNDTDYELWMPSDHDKTFQENCILGQQIRYWRRKRGSKCRNGESFMRQITKKACQCNEEDFECDFGYTRHNGTCLQDSWFDDSYIASQCIVGQTFSRSRGYRKVGSDKCVDNSNSTAKYLPQSNATCPLVAPAHLVLVANVTKVATGQPINLHLFQKRGSIHNSTVYKWNLNGTRNMTFKGLEAAQSQNVNFTKPGNYFINVTASNGKGKNSSNRVKISVEQPLHTVGVFSAWAAKVGFPLYISASTNLQTNPDGSLHFLYQFGDEMRGTKDTLTWDSEVLHTYNKSGTYNLFVTAVNSISAITKQRIIKVFDEGVMLELGFSNFKIFHGGRFHVVLQIVRHELCQILGLNLDRLSVNIIPNDTVHLQVLVLPSPPSAPSGEMTTDQIVQTFFDMVRNHTFYLFRSMGLSKSHGEISVISVKILEGKSDGGKKTTGANYRAVYIAIPIVLLAAIVTLLVLVYYRRRFRNIRRYTMVNQHEETDALLDDDEDEPPLDLRSDNRDDGRHDDSMLDLGTGSHLVMVTGTGGGDGPENC